MAELRIHSGADDDFLESYLWYANQSQWAAERFEKQVKLAFNKIAADPLGGTAYNETYRFHSLPNYPHLVVYRITADVVTILAIYHPSRDDAYWQTR